MVFRALGFGVSGFSVYGFRVLGHWGRFSSCSCASAIRGLSMLPEQKRWNSIRHSKHDCSGNSTTRSLCTGFDIILR